LGCRRVHRERDTTGICTGERGAGEQATKYPLPVLRFLTALSFVQHTSHFAFHRPTLPNHASSTRTRPPLRPNPSRAHRLGTLRPRTRRRRQCVNILSFVSNAPANFSLLHLVDTETGPFPTRPPLFTPAQLVQRRASAPAVTSSAPPPLPPKDFPSPNGAHPSPPSSQPPGKFASIFRRRASAPSVLPSSSSPSPTSSAIQTFPPPPGPPRQRHGHSHGYGPSRSTPPPTKRPSLFKRGKRVPAPLAEEDEGEEEERYGPLVSVAVALQESEPPVLVQVGALGKRA
jgi:hypothetical protein